MKKLLALFLVLIMAVGMMAGCTSPSTTDTAATTTDNTQAGTDAAAPEAAATEAATQAAGEIVLGCVNDLTGNRSVTGNAINNGATLAVEEINAAGGLLGSQIKFISYDNKNDPQESINAYTRLVDVDGACAVVVPDASSICMSLIEISTEKGVVACGMPSDPRAVMDTEGTGEAYPYMFLVGQCNAPQQASIIANYLDQNTELTKSAIFFDQSNAYAVANVKGFITEWVKLGKEVTVTQTCNAADQDFTTQLSKIKNSGAEFIYTPNPTAQLTIMVNQAHQLGLSIPYAGAMDMNDPFLSLLENPKVVTKAYFQSSAYMQDPRLAEFCANYEARFGEPATIKAVNGYDAVYIIAAAINAAGSADREAIKTALETSINGISLLCSENYVENGTTHSPDGLGMAVYEITEGTLEYKGYFNP